MIWNTKPSIDIINQFNKNTLVEWLGIEVIDIEDDRIMSKMPVDHRTKQPMGLLHGGASVVLSESIGSIASSLVVENPLKTPVVGLEINANHIKSVTSGFVFGTTYPIKIGKNIHLWQTDIFDEEKNIVCTSKLTVFVRHNS
jgi:1,4-dihydroxy-2-naphthoyl-CoA hydrolase